MGNSLKTTFTKKETKSKKEKPIVVPEFDTVDLLKEYGQAEKIIREKEAFERRNEKEKVDKSEGTWKTEEKMQKTWNGSAQRRCDQ